VTSQSSKRRSKEVSVLSVIKTLKIKKNSIKSPRKCNLLDFGGKEIIKGSLKILGKIGMSACRETHSKEDD